MSAAVTAREVAAESDIRAVAGMTRMLKFVEASASSDLAGSLSSRPVT